MAKPNITVQKLGGWDAYADKPAQEAIPEIYRRATEHSAAVRQWYWDSIWSKRWCSWGIRMVSFVLLLSGVVLPLAAAVSADDKTTLLCTQLGVMALAVAGLMMAADRIFGWSSGWLRYMTTVTAMEAATRQFELDWAGYFLTRTGPPGDADKQPLFQLARRLQDELSSRQSDETEMWCAEFNNGLAILNDLIKSQRESAENAVETMKKAQQTGSIEVTLLQGETPKTVRVSLDGGGEEEADTSWTKLEVDPGHHEIRITTVETQPHVIQKVVEVPPGGVARIEVTLP